MNVDEGGSDYGLCDGACDENRTRMTNLERNLLEPTRMRLWPDLLAPQGTIIDSGLGPAKGVAELYAQAWTGAAAETQAATARRVQRARQAAAGRAPQPCLGLGLQVRHHQRRPHAETAPRRRRGQRSRQCGWPRTRRNIIAGRALHDRLVLAGSAVDIGRPPCDCRRHCGDERTSASNR
jgi:hypothetical protein